MKIRNIFILLFIIWSCHSQIRDGKSFTSSELDYLKKLKVLDNDEPIILFDSQMDFESSGNFFTNRRFASYWIDGRDSSRNSVESVFFNEIDHLSFVDLSNSLTYASYIKIKRKSGSIVKIYVDGDSAEVWRFYKVAESVYEKKK